ncbi:MAG: penicillin-binding protein activator [Rhodospirillales bacterium]
MRNSVFRWEVVSRTIVLAVITISLAACQANQTGPIAPEQSVNRPILKKVPSSVSNSRSKPLEPVSRGKPLEPVSREKLVKPVLTAPLRLALLTPLSGNKEVEGREISNGAAMALLDTPEIAAELLSYDTGIDPIKAASAAASDNSDIIIGPLLNHEAVAISPILAKEGLIGLSFTKDSRIIGSNVFVMGRAIELETSRILRHAASTGSRRVAIFGRQGPLANASADQALREANIANRLVVSREIFGEKEDYTSIARKVSELTKNDVRQANRKENAAQLKANLNDSSDPSNALNSMAARYAGRENRLLESLARSYKRMTSAGTPSSSAINAIVTRYSAAGGLGKSPIDTFLLTVSGAELSTIAPMFQLYDSEAAGVRLLGFSRWKEMDPQRARELHGGRFPAEPTDDTFSNRYKAAFGSAPTELAGISYDAVRLALAAGRSETRPLPAEAIWNAGTIEGAHGPVRMSVKGMALRPLQVVEIQPDGFQVVEQALILDPFASTKETLGSK